MVASAARIAANRANASKSTGPKTPEGKERSRANSLKHGFCSTVVVHPDDALGLASDPLEAASSIPAARGFDAWLQGQLALATVKVERCQAVERAARSRIVLRASKTWDDDRRGEAIRLGSKLASRPEEVVSQLRETFHGCGWLIGRWALLARAADVQQGNWTFEQTWLAFDLLGTPHGFREVHPPGTSIDPAGRLVEATPGPAKVARRAIDELNERLERLRPIDEAARERAEADLSDDDPELRRLRRYEAEMHRRLKWALGLLDELAGPDEPDATPEGEPAPSPMAPPPRPTSRPDPAPWLGAPATRVERRLTKAESRREAKRRKLERALA